MQNVRRRPLSRRKCNYLRVHEIQNKSLLTVTTTPPFCATIPPCPLFIGHKLLHATIRSTFSLLPTILIRSTKVHHLKSTAIPVLSIVYNQPNPPTACTNHRQPTGLLSCFILFPDSTAPSACAFSSGNSIISLDTPFPPASAQSGTVPPP